MNRPHVLMFGGSHTFVGDWAKAAREVADVTLLEPPGPSLNLRPARVFAPVNSRLAARSIQAAIQTLADEGRPVDCLHTHFYSGCAGPLRVARRLGLPLVHTEHSSTILRREVSPAGRKLLRDTCRFASAVFAVSESLAEAMREYGVVEPIKVLRNPVDIARFSEAAVVAPYPAGEKTRFVNVGWLIPGKDHASLLQAFALVAARLPEARLDIVGGGPLEAQLRTLADSLRIGDRVRFLGARSRDEIIEAFAASHVYVHSSRYETFGVALVEAWAAGLPVVTFDCGGVSAMADEIGGRTIRHGDIEALAAAMVDGAGDVSIEMRLDTKRRALLHFDPLLVVGSLREAYRGVRV